ncbi:MAG TPA: cupin domain-containing protein [Stellaceae bacterium]|jgi:cupin 2 domain-containing protein
MNLLAHLPAARAQEIAETLASGRDIRIERIVSHGQASPVGFWYDQDEAEFVVLLSGAARLRFTDGEMRSLEPGDWIDIPAHRRHRVDWTDPEQPTVWLAIFYQRGHSGRGETESRTP